MFKKILIANRGEIAVRVIQTCREMGIKTVALYSPQERNSLHVRAASEALLFEAAFTDQQAILDVAKQTGADAIHPGYGFLAEEQEFVHACEAAGITFIGPSAKMLDQVHDKVATLGYARANGFRTVACSMACADDGLEEIAATAEALGYPVVIKSCYGGRGPGARLARTPGQLAAAVHSALAESRAVFGKETLYLEKAILPTNQVGVQLIADKFGSIVHLYERDGSLQHNNIKLIEETPSPALSSAQRAELVETAVALAKLLKLENVATAEFLVDSAGQFYFTEIKARIQTEHPITEMVTGIDLVREQIRVAAGEPLDLQQSDITLSGHAVIARVHAQDPLNQMRPSPGQLQQVRLPVGAGIRVDTYVQAGSDISEAYAPLVAKVSAWGSDRAQAVVRLGRALEDLALTGTLTDKPFLQALLAQEAFVTGTYSTETSNRVTSHTQIDEAYARDLAVMAAVLFAYRQDSHSAVVPQRLQNGWHRSSRRLAE